MNDSSSRALSPHPASRCTRYQPLLALLRTDALSSREAATLTEHLSGCPWCQRELATYDALDAAARKHLSAITFTPLTLEDIMQTSQSPTQAPAANVTPTHDEARRTARLLRPSGRPPISALAPLAAVIALILLAGLIFMTHGMGVPIGSGTPIPSATPSTSLTQTTWTLTQLIVDGHEQPLAPSYAPTLHLQPQDSRSGLIDGTGGCNSYGGSYALTGTTLHMSISMITLVACQSIRSTPETAYLQALPRVERFQLQGDALTLTSSDGRVRLTFHGIRDAALAQTTWTLTQFVVGKHEQPLVPSHTPTLTFLPQDSRGGTIQGTGGCNSYGGSYTLTGTTLHMSLSGITNMACPPDVMDEEHAYLDVLPRIKLFGLEGNTLTLTSADGNEQLTFQATQATRDAALTQSTWTLTQLVLDGHEHPLVPSHAPTLRFRPHDDPSGDVLGHSGCNGYSGSYTLASTSLHISKLGYTQMRCAPSGIMDQENAYLQALPRVERIQLEGDTLTLTSADGSVRLTFHGTRDVALTQTTWTLTRFFVNGDDRPIVTSHAPWLGLYPRDDKSGGYGGRTGCNSYSGSYTLASTTLHMSLLMITKMGCPPDLKDQETAYMSALDRVEHFQLEGDTLTLTNADGSVRLTFQA